MATEEGKFDVSFVGNQMKELFLKPLFRDADILNTFRIMGNVKGSRKMGFIGELEKIVRSNTGCGFKPVGGLDVTERKVTTNRMRADNKICWDEFMDTVLEQDLNHKDGAEAMGSSMMLQIMKERVKSAIKKDINRLFFFGNEGSLDPAYDLMDGFLTVHLPQLVADGETPYLDAGSGTALAAGDATEILRAIHKNQTNELKGISNSEKRIYVDGSVYEGYMEDLEDGSTEAARMAIINGQETLLYRGIQIVPQWEWDKIMETDLGTAAPHVAVLTTPRNLIVATDLLDASNEVRMWYDDEDEEFKTKVRFDLGGNYVHPSLASVAY